MSINKKLKHKVDIIYVTMTKGVRSTTTSTDVPAFITQKNVVLKDESGDHFGTRNVVFLKGDVTLDEIDELVFDSKQRPIISIFKVRTKSDAIHHLEVETQ
jgi:hypothetical protein